MLADLGSPTSEMSPIAKINMQTSPEHFKNRGGGGVHNQQRELRIAVHCVESNNCSATKKVQDFIDLENDWDSSIEILQVKRASS